MGIADHGAVRATDIHAVELTSAGVSPGEVVAVARRGVPVALGADARAAMERSAAVVARLPVSRDSSSEPESAAGATIQQPD